MHRRSVLSSTCVGCGVLLAGCVGGGGSDDEEAEEATEEGRRRDSAYIRNAVTEAVEVGVSLERKSDGEQIIENTYFVPPETALEIPAVGVEGDVYESTAEYDGTIEEHEWAVLSCSGGPDVDPGQSTSLEIAIREGSFHVGTIDCDESSLLSDLLTEDHEEYTAN